MTSTAALSETQASLRAREEGPSRVLSTLRRHWPYLALLFAGTAYLLVLSLTQHRALGTGYDLGIYDQVVWNLSHGRLFQTTLVYETNGYYDHFEPILTLFAPLYWLWPSPNVLLIVQALALGLGSLPIYLYANDRFRGWERGPLLAWVIAAAYLAYPALHNANLNDFHEVSLLPPLLGFALYGLLTGRPRLMLVFLILCLMVKEDFSVTFMMFGVYIMAFKPAGFKRSYGLFIAAGAAVWMLLVLYVFYPAMTHGMPYPFVDRRYPWLGDSPESAARVLFTQPWVVLPHLTQTPKLLFVLRLLAPLLFVPLLGWPVFILALPVLAYLMLSNYEPQWSVQSYYNPPLLPILFFAFIIALDYIHRWLTGRLGWSAKRVELAMAVLTLLSVGISYYIDAPGPGSRNFRLERFSVTPRVEAAQRIMSLVPPDASISTVWPLVPHLSERRRIYTVLARPQVPPGLVLLEQSAGAEGAPIYPYAAPDGQPTMYHQYRPVATDGPFELLAYDRSTAMTVLDEPEPPPTPLSVAGYTWLGEQGDPPQVGAGDTARLMLAWRRTAALDARYVLFVHVLKDGSAAAANGLPEIVAQSGHEPGDGHFPTTQWETWTNPGIVLDEQQLEIPAETPPGVYYAWAGAFDRDTGQRIELGGPGKTLALIGPLVVSAPHE